ncbi:MAG: CbrC family protein [Gemmatimonadaceae bacterium]|nr:CbrC family protein [Gemmatimonadaceae bacterium]
MTAPAEALPSFRYHPDPIATGSVVASPDSCVACQRPRGFLYVGPVYTEADIEDRLCPWCIADGTAYRSFEATFTDSESIDDASDAQRAELMERTPGFHAWQGERWLACCNEPAAFIGAFGIEEIRAQFPRLEGPLMMHIVHELGVSGGAARRILESLAREEAPTAFVFQCLHCDSTPAYVDQA